VSQIDPHRRLPGGGGNAGPIRHNARIEITEAHLPDDAGAIVDFVATRTPKYDRVILRSDLNPETAGSLRVVVAREPEGTPAGVGVARTASNLPAGALFVIVSTRADLGGLGIGSRLYAAVLADLDDDVTHLVACVLDGDLTSLDVAGHWGFRHQQLTVTTCCALGSAMTPEATGGVTLEACDDLVFDDDPAVEAMLLASQTNPEVAVGLVHTLTGFRETAAPGQRPVAVLTRVEGRPAGMSFALADGDQMHVIYTGVHPALRGRALGRLTKEFLHAHAHDLGIRMALTDNEERNTGIRHINDRLGYTGHSTWHWLIRDRP
jgi:GNAT superfamily N-acetyltransferase